MVFGVSTFYPALECILCAPGCAPQQLEEKVIVVNHMSTIGEHLMNFNFVAAVLQVGSSGKKHRMGLYGVDKFLRAGRFEKVINNVKPSASLSRMSISVLLNLMYQLTMTRRVIGYNPLLTSL